MNVNFRFFVKIHNYDFYRNHILITLTLNLIANYVDPGYVIGERISALDQNSNRPFLKNEFSKIFEDIFKVTLFTEMIRFRN